MNTAQMRHIEIMRNFLTELNKETDTFILKGGTSLLLAYGLDRFSENIDLDGEKRHLKGFIESYSQKHGFSFRKLAAYEQAHGIRILVGTVKNTHGQVLGKIANAVVDRIESGGENGTIVLLLAPKERDFDISTDDKMRTRITDDDGIEHLAGQFVPSLKENKYAEGFTALAAAVDEMVTYYEQEGKPFNPDAFLFTIVTLVGALIPAAIVYWFILADLSDSMLSVRSAHEADDYVERGSFRLTHRADIFLRTTESRETKYKKTSSSSSSGSYISTSSRDSSHGGGGGKY